MKKTILLSLILITSILLSTIVLAKPELIGIQKQPATEIITNQTLNDQGNSTYEFITANSTENEIINVTLKDSKVQNWTKTHPNYEVYAYYDSMGIWVVEFSALSNPDEQLFSQKSEKIFLGATLYVDYLDVYVSDSTHEIIGYQEYTQKIEDESTQYPSALHTEQEVWAALTKFKPTREYLNQYPESEKYLYFYEGFWEASLEYYNQSRNEFFYYVALIDDLTLNVLTVYSNTNTSLTKMNTKQAISEALTYEPLNDFLKNKTYVAYPSFMWWSSENNSDAIWEIDFYITNDSLDFSDENNPLYDTTIIGYLYYYLDYASIYLMDSTKQILQAVIPVSAKLNDSQVISIADQIPEIQEFLKTIPGVTVSTYYDAYSQKWYLEYLSSIILEAYAYVVISDADGSVIEYQTHYPSKMPQLSIGNVIQIVDNSNVIQSISDYEPLNYSIYYFNGTWSVYVYSFIYVEAYAYLEISDESGQIIVSGYNLPAIPPTLSPDAVLNITNELEDVQEFKANHSDWKVSIYYFSGEWEVVYHTPDWTCAYYVIVDDATGDIVDQWLVNGNYYEAELPIGR